MIKKSTALSICSAVLVLLGCCWSAVSYGQTFTNPNAIVIPTVGNATPYPSNITVTGGPTSIVSVAVTLTGVTHTWPDDIDVVLVAPNGDALSIMSDCGNQADVVNANYTIADYASAGFVNNALNPTGTYRPSDFPQGVDNVPGGPYAASAPTGAATFASVFGGDNANGVWSLRVVDDTGGDQGSITGGWSITFANIIPGCTNPTALNYNPNATQDNGSCVFCAPGQSAMVFNMFDTFGDGWNGASYFITNLGGTVIATGTLGAGTSGSNTICLNPGCYNLTITAGAWPGEVGWNIADLSGNILLSASAPDAAPNGPIGISWGGATGCNILGCTQPECFNYNPFADVDDGSCQCPVANDECSGAIDIGCGVSVTGTTNNSSLESSSPDCLGFGVTAPGVWYRLIGTGDQIIVSTCASSPNGTFTDTQLHVYSGSCGSLTCVAANDDDPNCQFFKSTVAFSSVAGVSYYILVSESGLGVGLDFILTVECQDCDTVIINDVCSSALPQPNGIATPVNLCCAAQDQTLSAFISGYGVWFTTNSGSADSFEFLLANGNGPGLDPNDGTNVGMIIYQGPCGALTPIAQCPTVADVCAGSLSEAGIPIQQNTDYYFLVYTTDPANCGTASLTTAFVNLGCTDAAADNYDPLANQDDGSCSYSNPPANDLCGNAIPLTCNTTIIGSTGLASATGAPAACGISATDPSGVWYTIAGDGQVHTLSTCGSVTDTRIEVVSSTGGCAGPFTCVIGEDNDGTDEGCGFFEADDASVVFTSTPGLTYYVYITTGALDVNNDGVDDLFDGAFTIDYECAPLVQGCTDPCACNYNPSANISTPTCEFFSCVGCALGEFTLMLNMDDSFGDGWNGADYTIEDLDGNMVTTGSLDDAQCSSDLDNNIGPDFGFDMICLPIGCYTITVGGGVWDTEITWNLMDDGGTVLASGADESIDFTVGPGTCGCTDPGACNFDPNAATDDGTCEYVTCAGCTDVTACNFNPDATIPANNLCCFDNCVTLLMNDEFGDGWNGAVATITNLATGTVAGTATLNEGVFGLAPFCLEDGCYSITVSAGVWPAEVDWTLIGVNGIVNGGAPEFEGVQFTVGDGVCNPGCPEPFACNYDPNAGISDCTLCEYTSCQGCTYPEATNYDPAALIDDGSCLIEASNPCPADINEDGIVGVGDLIIFIAAFGQVCN